MKPEINDIIAILAKDVEAKLPKAFENRYYEKMSYSEENKIIELDKKLLHETISFEIAFIHVVLFVFNEILKYNKCYHALLEKLDIDELFSWYTPTEHFIEENLKQISIVDFSDIYLLINQHDKLIHKDIKKKLGQFYTPVNIVQRMVNEIKNNLKNLTVKDRIIDPACGTGVFVVEAINMLSGIFSVDELIKYANHNIFAFDVNPFAVVATKINIIYTLFLQSGSHSGKIVWFVFNSDLLFPNIQWKNTIVEEDFEEYTIILGNPPYFKLNNKLTKNITGYDEILYGQPNIYSYFMYWGMQHLKKDGAMCFIVPQSMRSGLYFKNLRAKMYALRIRAIIHIDSRQNVFDRAEQAVLIICLENKPVMNTKTKIQFYNGNGTINTEFKIARSKLMMDETHNNIFVISKKVEMYDILDKVHANSSLLDSEQRNLRFCNGLFVWNQHKNDIVDLQENSIPIIYGGNVQPLAFNFAQCSNNEERKQFAIISKETSSYVLTGKRLLVQRTTNFEKDIRLKACIISDEFLINYKSYFLENHINFLSSDTSKDELLTQEVMYYYLGLLNSKLINYIFASKSGNTQVSANELNSLPFPLGNIGIIADFVINHTQNLKGYQKELDLLVCNAYGLSESEADFIIKYEVR